MKNIEKKCQQFTFQHSPERMVLNSSEVSECDMLRSTVIPLYLSLVTESGLNEVWMSVWLFLHQLHTEGSRLRDPIAGSNLQKEKTQCWQVFTKYTFNYSMVYFIYIDIFMGCFF